MNESQNDKLALQQGFFFSQERAEKSLVWMSKHLGISLYNWQKEILSQYFGWRNAEGRYRYQTLSIWIPKKNGKSFLISALLGYKLFELKQCNIYSVAYNSKQASIILDGTIRMLKNGPLSALLESGHIKCFSSPYRREINNLITDVKYIALADNENANDGLIGQCLIVDEIHRMKNRLYDVSRGCIHAIPNALEVIISTAGTGDKTHISWDKYSYAKGVKQDTILDISTLPIIYEHSADISEPDAIYSLDTALEVNPVLQESPEKRREFVRQLAEARQNRNDQWWRRFVLNQWVSTDGECYIPQDVYAATERAAEPAIAGCPVYVGVDRGGQWDMTAVAMLYILPDGSLWEKHFLFAVDDRLEEMGQKDDHDYSTDVASGDLLLVPTDAIYDEWITEWLKKQLAGQKIMKIALDPYLAAYIAETLATSGYRVTHVPQGNNRLLSPVIEDYADRVRQKRTAHRRNALVDWQITCCHKIITAKDVAKLVKKGSNRLGRGGSGHIDSVDALINAMAALRVDEISQATKSTGIVSV